MLAHQKWIDSRARGLPLQTIMFYRGNSFLTSYNTKVDILKAFSTLRLQPEIGQNRFLLAP
ncbi:MAG: hypothetical protein DRR16_09270 [Candidatus Parabeggiatoa sp. nov. 3]|nr:MAG: hypothetical protein DRR00_15570 [Gammaproteobacteria bacterium]RKZ62223.1 MAG: hypothetical protein DRQ99_19125 [Gammaproteobacteria bacterium]RKZ86599.1 MAG: hypothetical protein DRR16_09270 [Gammaproteobacteria bacterium]